MRAWEIRELIPKRLCEGIENNDNAAAEDVKEEDDDNVCIAGIFGKSRALAKARR